MKLKVANAMIATQPTAQNMVAFTTGQRQWLCQLFVIPILALRKYLRSIEVFALVAGISQAVMNGIR